MRKFLILFLIGVNVATGLFAQRNPEWAVPIEAQSVQNLYMIDEGVYRSAQPDAAGFEELDRIGISEVLNLRFFVGDDKYTSALILHHVKMLAGNCDWDKTVQALRIIKDRKGPIVIHCKHGSDRTGMVSALYRIVFQGWDKETAIDELLNGGYDFHTVYKNIPSFIRNMDTAALKEAVMKD